MPRNIILSRKLNTIGWCKCITLWYSGRMECPKACLFDLDETLAPSYSAISEEMASLLARLTDICPVALMTGAGFDRVERDVLSKIGDKARTIYVFPNSCAQYFRYRDTAWQMEYNKELTEDDRERIAHAMNECLDEIGELHGAPRHGMAVVDRGSQVAFAFLGIDATLEERRAWDPDSMKRFPIAKVLARKLPQYNVYVGGAATIDVTQQGIDKAYGVRYLAREMGIEPHEMLYLGDALYEGGNDAVVVPTGVHAIQVTSPAETERIIGEVLAACTAAE